MSDTDSFISEVTEEVRRDTLYRTFRRYRWALVAVVAALIGAAAWSEISNLRETSGARERGDALRAAIAIPDPAARATALEGLNDGRAEPVARMAAAGAEIAAGDPGKAGAVLAEAAADPKAPEIYRALAALQRVMALGPTLDAGERLAALDLLAAPGAPFRPLALEQRAILRVEQGDRAAAAADLQAIIAAPDAPQPLQGRARQLLEAVGGGVAAAAAAETPAAETGAAETGATPEEATAGTTAPEAAGAAAPEAAPAAPEATAPATAATPEGDAATPAPAQAPAAPEAAAPAAPAAAPGSGG